MTWREEAKELGIPLYDHELKKIRKKADVLADMASKSYGVVNVSEPVNIIISVKEANQICSEALFGHVAGLGFKDVSIETPILRFIHKNQFLNCKRRGIVFSGVKNGRTDESREEAGNDTGVSGCVQHTEREDSPEGIEEASSEQRDGDTAGQSGQD